MKKIGKNQRKKTTKNGQSIFIFFYQIAPLKSAQGKSVNIANFLKGFLKRMKRKSPLKVEAGFILQILDGVSKTRSTQLPLEDWVFISEDFLCENESQELSNDIYA